MSLSSLAVFPADPREHEIRLLVDLVRLSRLTLLYAEPGADKSTVIRSSVMPLLQAAPGGRRTEVAILLDTWIEPPLALLKARIDQTVAETKGGVREPASDPGARSLVDILAGWQDMLDVAFIIVFDRFEDYLAAPLETPGIREFEEQFVEVVNHRTLRANFLLSLDEDAAPLLSRLRERIPGLGDARVRLPRASPAAPPVEAPEQNGPQAPVSRAYFGSGPASGETDRAASKGASELTSSAPREARDEAAHGSAAPLFYGSESVRQQPKRGESLVERLEQMRTLYSERTAPAPLPSASPAIGVPAATAPLGDSNEDEALSESSLIGEPIAAAVFNPPPIRQAEEQVEARVWPPLPQPSVRTDAIKHQSFRISTRAWAAIAAALVVLSFLLLLGYRLSAERAADATHEAASPAVPAQQSSEAAPSNVMAPESVVRPDDDVPLRTEQEYFASRDWLGYDTSAAATPAKPPAPGDATQAPAGASPSADSAARAEVAAPKTPLSAPGSASTAAPSGPLLYIHVRSEAQRASAERMIRPLARRGIRVTGIKVVSFGPPVPDLRYFRSSERDEAVKVALALRNVGVPTQRLNHIAGYETKATRRQYELWLPPARRTR